MKTTSKIALLLFPTLFIARAASAAQASDGEAPATVSAGPTQAAAGGGDDPNIDRAFLLPTAMTQPGGSGTYNNYELVLHGFTYGVTDRVQVTLTVLPPLVKDLPFVGFGAAKWQAVSTSRFHLALQGSVGGAWESPSQSSSSGALVVGGGVYTSLCLRDDCSSLASASATYQLAVPDSGRNGQLLIYGGSIVHAVSEHLKLLAEVASMASNETSSSGWDNVNGALVSYGVRLHNKNLASDVGFVKPISKSGNGDFILGLPFASLSYRWM